MNLELPNTSVVSSKRMKWQSTAVGITSALPHWTLENQTAIIAQLSLQASKTTTRPNSLKNLDASENTKIVQLFCPLLWRIAVIINKRTTGAVAKKLLGVKKSLHGS